MKCLYEVHKRLHGDWSQIPARSTNIKTDRLVSDSPSDPTLGATITTYAFLATWIAAVRIWFQFFRHLTNRALLQSNVTDIGYYIGSIRQHREGQKSLTNFTIQLKMIKFQENVKRILFDAYIHEFFSYTQCSSRWASCVARRKTSRNPSSSHTRTTVPLSVVMVTSLIRVFRSSTSVTTVVWNLSAT
jgi:hypothetical protein